VQDSALTKTMVEEMIVYEITYPHSRISSKDCMV